jgi:DNA-binding CsgD family transcriptional regulator
MDAPARALRLVGLLQESPEATFVVAMDGTIVYWNAAAAELFGIPTSRALRRPCHLVVRGCTASGEPVCGPGCHVQVEARLGRAVGTKELMIRPEGRGAARWVQLHHVGLRDENGQPAAMLHLVDDVQARRAREQVGRRLAALLSTGSVEAALVSPLTPREREVFRLLAAGQTGRQIATTLAIAYSTARTHIQRVLEKLGAQTRVAAVVSSVTADTDTRR